MASVSSRLHTIKAPSPVVSCFLCGNGNHNCHGRDFTQTCIRFHAHCHDPSLPSLFSKPSIKLLLKGIFILSPGSPDRRWPIAMTILQRLLFELLSSKYSPHFASLLKSD
uniref:Uncharacterized protein n=1 Tax=Knipowitschia caucasica TaxID=637954 RepID=A0AAV2L1P0_KNICA